MPQRRLKLREIILTEQNNSYLRKTNITRELRRGIAPVVMANDKPNI